VDSPLCPPFPPENPEEEFPQTIAQRENENNQQQTNNKQIQQQQKQEQQQQQQQKQQQQQPQQEEQAKHQQQQNAHSDAEVVEGAVVSDERAGQTHRLDHGAASVHRRCGSGSVVGRDRRLENAFRQATGTNDGAEHAVVPPPRRCDDHGLHAGVAAGDARDEEASPDTRAATSCSSDLGGGETRDREGTVQRSSLQDRSVLGAGFSGGRPRPFDNGGRQRDDAAGGHPASSRGEGGSSGVPRVLPSGSVPGRGFDTPPFSAQSAGTARAAIPDSVAVLNGARAETGEPTPQRPLPPPGGGDATRLLWRVPAPNQNLPGAQKPQQHEALCGAKSGPGVLEEAFALASVVVLSSRVGSAGVDFGCFADFGCAAGGVLEERWHRGWGSNLGPEISESEFLSVLRAFPPGESETSSAETITTKMFSSDTVVVETSSGSVSSAGSGVSSFRTLAPITPNRINFDKLRAFDPRISQVLNFIDDPKSFNDLFVTNVEPGFRRSHLPVSNVDKLQFEWSTIEPIEKSEVLNVCRYFQVPKKGQEDRLIVNCSPINVAQLKPPRMRLPSIHDVIRRVLNFKLGLTIDAVSFFYQFPLQRDIARHFALAQNKARGRPRPAVASPGRGRPHGDRPGQVGAARRR